MNPGDKFCFKCGSRFAEISHLSARISTPYDERASSSSSTKSLSKAEERRGYKLLTAKQLSRFEKERQRSRNPPPPPPPQEVGYLGTAQTFLLMSLYCSLLFHTADRILHCSQTLPHAFMAELTSYFVCKRLQTLCTLITLKRL